MSMILLVHGAISGILRRVVKDAPEDSWPTHLCAGEAMLVVEDHPECWFGEGGFPNLPYLQMTINAALGIEAPSSRCVALAADWTVAKVVLGDPRLDVWNGLVIVQDDEAQEGWILTPWGFVPPPREEVAMAA